MIGADAATLRRWRLAAAVPNEAQHVVGMLWSEIAPHLGTEHSVMWAAASLLGSSHVDWQALQQLARRLCRLCTEDPASALLLLFESFPWGAPRLYLDRRRPPSGGGTSREKELLLERLCYSGWAGLRVAHYGRCSVLNIGVTPRPAASAELLTCRRCARGMCTVLSVASGAVVTESASVLARYARAVTRTLRAMQPLARLHGRRCVPRFMLRLRMPEDDDTIWSGEQCECCGDPAWLAPQLRRRLGVRNARGRPVLMCGVCHDKRASHSCMPKRAGAP